MINLSLGSYIILGVPLQNLEAEVIKSETDPGQWHCPKKTNLCSIQ
jgi:hypothetical protein